MNAGPLRNVVAYQIKSEAPDDYGQMQETWVDHSIHRANVRAPRGTEATVALQVKAFVSVMIETRFPGFAFSPAGRLVDRTDAAHPKVWNIVSSVDPDNRRRKLVTMATEAASAVSIDSANM